MASSGRWPWAAELAITYVAAAAAALGSWALGAKVVGVQGPAATPWARGSERAIVARVVDGDTIELADGRTVRLLGLDAPETVSPALGAAQPLGAEASTRLARMLTGREVVLERDRTEADHYGRLLRHVWLGRTLVAEALVAEGLAWSNAVPPDDRHRPRIRDAEERARAEGVGLWGLLRPTPLAVFGPTGRPPDGD